MKRSIILAVTTVGLLTWLPATGRAGFGDLAPYFSFEYGDGGGIPTNVYNVTSQQTSPDGQSVTLMGSLGPIDGADFGNNFVLYWTGGFEGPIGSGDSFTAGLNFNAQASGGTLSWSFYSDLWSNEGFESARILTDQMAMPTSDQVSGLQLESSQFTQPGETGIFEGYLNIDWSGYSPTDTFSIDVNSINITFTPVPEPDTLLLIAALALAIVIWRWGRISVGRYFIRCGSATLE